MVLVSPNNIISVLGYTPTEGEPGTPISVRLDFSHDIPASIYVRLLVGPHTPSTAVHELHDSPGHWQLDTLAPPLSPDSPSPKLPLSVEALDHDGSVLDSVSFGEFSYWIPGSSRPECDFSPTRPKLRINTDTGRSAQNISFRRRGSSHLATPSPSSPSRSRSFSTSKGQQVQLHRRSKADTISRQKNGKTSGDLQAPILDLTTELASLCIGWSPAELHVGRRLVKFTKVQDGRRLIVSCEAIKAEEYQESDSVISCIYREENKAFFVTSVDIIFLLERLTNSEFPVEEKNRIRRNLEGLRPTTVSKHKPGYEDFFQKIMEFPDPKPRNIEKDLKVFEWFSLGQALEKILSKYTVDTSPLSVEGSESSGRSPSSSSEDIDHQQLSYPSVKAEGAGSYTVSSSADENTVLVHSSASTIAKMEHLNDDFGSILAAADVSDALCSPLQAPPPYHHLYADMGQQQHAGASGSGNWNPEYKIDQYPYHDVTQQPAIVNYSEIDLQFGFPGGISGEGLEMPGSEQFQI